MLKSLMIGILAFASLGASASTRAQGTWCFDNPDSILVWQIGADGSLLAQKVQNNRVTEQAMGFISQGASGASAVIQGVDLGLVEYRLVYRGQGLRLKFPTSEPTMYRCRLRLAR